MYIQHFCWTLDGQPVADLCQELQVCQKGTAHCSHARTVYLNKPFEGHAKLHLATFRPLALQDAAFHTQVLQELKRRHAGAHIRYRYFQHIPVYSREHLRF